MIAFAFLAVLWMNVVYIESNLVMRFGVLFDLLVSFSGLSVLLSALLRAPEGYEDANGFHVGALADAALP